MRSLSKPRSPRQSASSTVVTPLTAHCASCVEHGRTRRPARVAAGLHLALEIVGVHVDDARHQIVAVEVDRAGRVAAAGLRRRGSCRRPARRVPCDRPRRAARGAALVRMVVMRRPAGERRGTRCRPRRRAPRCRGRCRRGRSRAPSPRGSCAITTSRFSASSEAVGSSSSRIGWPPMKPRARLTRCCSPPEKVAGGSAVQPARDVEPQQQASAAARACVRRRAAAARPRRRRRAPGRAARRAGTG